MSAAPDSPIPIRNLYRMLLYAWNVLEECDPGEVDRDGPTSLADLFGIVLCRHMEPILRRGLEQSYVEHEEALAGIRGRILLGPTVLRRLDRRGKAMCRFDERSVDVPVNRLVLATTGLLLRAEHLSGKVEERLVALRRYLAGVRHVRPDAHLLRQVHLHRNNRRYKVPVAVCRFVIRRIAPAERCPGETDSAPDAPLSFAAFTRDEHAMRRLFEAFVRGFARIELRPPHPRTGRRSPWPQVETSSLVWSHAPNQADEVPGMRTDVTLRWPDHVRVVECKYTRTVFTKGRFGRRMLTPGYVRQLHAYMAAIRDGRFASGRPDWLTPATTVDGLLLHAAPRAEVAAMSIRLGAHEARVRTLALDEPWPVIASSLGRFLGGASRPIMQADRFEEARATGSGPAVAYRGRGPNPIEAVWPRSPETSG